MEETNLTPEQAEKIKQQRLQSFQKAGLPAGAGQMVTVTPPPPIQEFQQSQQPQPVMDPVSTGTILEQVREQLALQRQQSQAYGPHATQAKMKAIEDIKRGAKRNTFKVFTEKEKIVSAAGNQIPEPKMKRNPMQQKSNVKAPPLASPPPPSRIAEADNFEKMFIDTPSINFSSTPTAVDNMNVQTDYSSGLPSFDPLAALRQKAAAKGEYSPAGTLQRTAQPSSELSEIKTLLESVLKQKNSDVDTNSLRPLIESIAKDVAIKAINEVIGKYAETQKNKKLYEVYNKDQNIVKIDNKLFKLTPVIIKQK